MRFLLFLILLFVSNSFATETFFIKKLSKNYDVKIEVKKNEYGYLRGKATFTIFKKNSQKPFQTFNFRQTLILLDDNGQPEIEKIKNSKYSSIYLEDFNFDGYEDLALCDGSNGGYSSTSYKVYIFNVEKKHFVFNKKFTYLAQGPFYGIFKIDYKKRSYEVSMSSGYGFYETQRYKLIGKKLVKYYVCSRSADLKEHEIWHIDTSILINGKWKIWYRTEKDKI